jgi:hypothetical protein
VKRRFLLGLIALSSCGREAADEAEVLEAALVAASAEFKTDKLCIRPTLIERPSAHNLNRWAYMGAPTPPGFWAVETPTRPDGYHYAEKPVPEVVAKRWRLSGSEKDLCAQATIPAIAQDRALVSFTFEEMEGGFPRINYWLESKKGERRVARRNQDHQDI